MTVLMNIKELLSLPATKLKRIVELKAQIESLHSQLENLAAGAGSSPKAPKKTIRKRRKMSAAARRKISMAAKARWAKVRAAKSK
jgi:hypothetical protein